VNSGTIKIELDDEDISLNSDGVTDILGDRISVRINEHDDYAAVVKVVTIGPDGNATPTATIDVNATPTATMDINATPTPTPPPTETPEPTPTETGTPGFEAVFAVAGLLAVAYLVLRQRE